MAIDSSVIRAALVVELKRAGNEGLYYRSEAVVDLIDSYIKAVLTEHVSAIIRDNKSRRL